MVKRLFILLFLSLLIDTTNAQLIAEAGDNDTVCSGYLGYSTLGSIQTATGGQYPYTYKWSPSSGIINPTSSNPVAQPTETTWYYVTVTDNVNDTAVDSTLIMVININFDSVTSSNVSCNGLQDGSICLIASGGIEPYWYSWSNGNIGNVSCPMNGLASGNYSVSVTDEYNCTGSVTFLISQPAQLVIDSFVSQGVVCSHDTTGNVCVYVSGGTNPYRYEWSFADTLQCKGGLLPGNYRVTVNDANNCTLSATIGVLQSDNLAVRIDSVTNATCFELNNGKAFIRAINGCVPYNFLWSDSTAAANHINLPAGLHEVTVSDCNGCSASASLNIFGLPSTPIDITTNTSSICEGQQVQFDIHFSDSSPSLACGPSSSWTAVDSGSILQPGNALQPPSLLSNFSKSTRSQILFKADELLPFLGGACTISGIQFQLGVFNSNAYVQLSLQIGATISDSLTGWLTDLVPVFNTNSFQPNWGWLNQINFQTGYYWDGISNIVLDICSNNPNTFGNQNNKAMCSSTSFISYIHSYSSYNQCALPNVPLKYSLRPNVRFRTCPPDFSNHQFEWSPSTGIDAVSNPTIKNPTAQPMNPTNYYVSVTNNWGCIVTDSIFIETIQGPEVNSETISNVTCYQGNDGSVCVHVSGSNPNYTYNWQGTTNNDSCLSSLSAGTYNVTVTDANGCFAESVIEITEPPILDVVIGSSTGGLLPDTLLLNITGGTPPYNYLWNPSIASNPPIITQFQSYYLTVTDANNCTVADEYTPILVGYISLGNMMKGFLAYPNLVDNALYIEMPRQGDYVFELINTSGQVVERREIKQVDIINVKGVDNGFYILSVKDSKSGKEIGSKKVVVRHP